MKNSASMDQSTLNIEEKNDIIPDNRKVREYLEAMQNPKDCESARKLVCPMRRTAGFGSCFHEVVTCFMHAALTNRTVMLSHQPGDVLTRTEWEEYFLPISTSCREWAEPAVPWRHDHEQHKVVTINGYKPHKSELSGWRDGPPKWIPVPPEVQDPFVWWAGHIVQYLFRLQPAMHQHVEKAKAKLGFAPPLPGMHIRRTDKLIKEAKYVDVELYMEAIRRYYDNKKESTEKRVYVATDEPNAITELRMKYPDYTFLFELDTINIANTPGLARTGTAAHIGIITDIQLLLDCEFVACTLSSNICRLFYEVINSNLMNNGQTFASLDKSYEYFC